MKVMDADQFSMLKRDEKASCDDVFRVDVKFRLDEGTQLFVLSTASLMALKKNTLERTIARSTASVDGVLFT